MAVSEQVQEKLVGFQPKLVINQPSHYCPGCQYGLLTRLLAEVIEDLDRALRARTVRGAAGPLVYKLLKGRAGKD